MVDPRLPNLVLFETRKRLIGRTGNVRRPAMSDSVDPDAGPAAVLADPRVDPEHLRLVTDPERPPVLLVGVVHDHPASRYRVRSLVEALSPDVVGVELPHLAVPLFESVGRDSASGEAGEMAVALAAGADRDARRVGIDRLDGRFLERLVAELRSASPSLRTVRRVLGDVATVGRHAVSCRVAAALGRTDAALAEAKRTYDAPVDASAPPAEQAADERRQLTRSRSVLRAVERPAADLVVDAARERTMAATLDDLRNDGRVVAVVGFDHLDDVADELRDAGAAVGRPDRESLVRHWVEGVDTGGGPGGA